MFDETSILCPWLPAPAVEKTSVSVTIYIKTDRSGRSRRELEESFLFKFFN